VLAGFSDRNIVTIYDNDRIGDIAYIAMELLPGGTLLERMQRGPIRVGEALGLVIQVASALEAAHRQQVIHRNLKPANIMLRDETTPVLTDFGAVRVLDRRSQHHLWSRRQHRRHAHLYESRTDHRAAADRQQ